MAGPKADPDFPWLDEGQYFRFPPLRKASPEGIICSGGNLSPGMLLSAYRQGIFPWFNDTDPILWWSPDPRFVLLPDELHVSDTMRKTLRKGRFRLTVDTAFDAVIEHCAGMPRPGQHGTWITRDMQDAYRRMHALGYAHSAEAWLDNRLAGGLYGLSLGLAFFGESMFSLESNASKAIFIPLVWYLKAAGCTLIDSQVHTNHVAGLGGRHLPRTTYLQLLEAALDAPTKVGSWTESFKDFPESPDYRHLLGTSH